MSRLELAAARGCSNGRLPPEVAPFEEKKKAGVFPLRGVGEQPADFPPAGPAPAPSDEPARPARFAPAREIRRRKRREKTEKFRSLELVDPRGMEVEALPAAGAAAELGGGALGELADGDIPELRPGGAEPALPPAPAKAVSRRQSLTDITNRDHDADLAPPCGGDPPPPPEDLAPPAMAPGQVSSPCPPRPAGSCAPPRERTVGGRGRDEVEGGERPALHIEARSTTPRGRCPRPPRSSPSGSAFLGGEPSAKALCPPATPAQWGLTR